jgi:hypothetical protein
LLGLLSAEEKATYEVLLATNGQVADQVLAQQGIYDAIVRTGLKSSAGKAWKIYRKRIWMMRMIVVALMIAAALLGFAAFSGTGESRNIVPMETSTSPIGDDGVANSLANETEVESTDEFTAVADEKSGEDERHVAVVSNRKDMGNESDANDQEISAQEHNVVVNDAGAANLNASFIIKATNDLSVETVTNIDSNMTESCEWIITASTTEKDLWKISEQIRSERGKLLVDRKEFRRGKLVAIKFTVSSRTGAVNYEAEGIDENTKICIRMEGSSISAGNCEGQVGSSSSFQDERIFSSDSAALGSIDKPVEKDTLAETDLFDESRKKFKSRKKRNNPNFKSDRKKRKSFFEGAN